MPILAACPPRKEPGAQATKPSSRLMTNTYMPPHLIILVGLLLCDVGRSVTFDLEAHPCLMCEADDLDFFPKRCFCLVSNDHDQANNIEERYKGIYPADSRGDRRVSTGEISVNESSQPYSFARRASGGNTTR